MHLISLAGSERQKSKLRNGHKVRIKHGAGFNVIVSPNTYHLVSRAFNKNKGVQIQLTPEEIAMNKAPSPELQAQIMGHSNHMILPNATGALIKGSGIGDWFKNIGNTIKSGWENTIQKPIEEKIIKPVEQKIVAPAKGLYNQYVKPYEGDIKTGLKLANPLYGYSTDFVKQLAMGRKPKDIVQTWGSDLQHLNQTKNKIIRSDPILTEAYKSAMPKLAGLATGSLAGTMGFNPVLAGAAGVAGERLGQRALEAEGYGLHHAIRLGLHFHPEHHKHRCAIGGKLGFHHVTNFFKHAGQNVKNWVNDKFIPAAKTTYTHAKTGANMMHNWLLDHPEFAQLVKHHGAKLAGLAAKEGIKYLGGSDELANIAGDVANDAAHTGFEEHLGYGLGGALSFTKKPPKPTKVIDETHNYMHPTTADYNKMVQEKSNQIDKRKADEKQNKILQQREAEQNAKAAAEKKRINMEFDTAMEHQEKEHRAMKEAQAKSEMEQREAERKRKADNYNNRSFTNAPSDSYVNTPKTGFWSNLINWFTGKKEQEHMPVSYHNDPAAWKDKWGSGLYVGQGGGLYAGGGAIGEPHNNVVVSPFAQHNHMSGMGFNSYQSIYDMNAGTALANAHLGGLNHRTIEGQIHQAPIRKYWDGEGEPPSRGTGIHPHHHSHHHGTEHLHNRGRGFGSNDHYNLMGGKGRLMEHSAHLPVALVSQPYGTNFHMQFQLPPEYHKFNDGTYTF